MAQLIKPFQVSGCSEILLSQCHYDLNLLFKLEMVESKALTTPLDRDLKLQVESGTTTHDSTHYRQGIRSLIYFILSQPSDSYTFGFNDCIMFDAVDVTILLHGGINFGFGRKFGGSTIYIKLQLSLGSDTISYSSNQQTAVALASMEAKYKGGVLWLLKLKPCDLNRQ